MGRVLEFELGTREECLINEWFMSHTVEAGNDNKDDAWSASLEPELCNNCELQFDLGNCLEFTYSSNRRWMFEISYEAEYEDEPSYTHSMRVWTDEHTVIINGTLVTIYVS
jgi:hypothetical protein